MSKCTERNKSLGIAACFFYVCVGVCVCVTGMWAGLREKKARGLYLTSLTMTLHPSLRQAFCVRLARDPGRACLGWEVGSPCVCACGGALVQEV